MSKSILRSLILLSILFLGSFSVFFFWAKAPNLQPADYTSKTTFKLPPHSESKIDSTFSLATYNIGYLSGMTNNEAVVRSADFFESNLEQAIPYLKTDILALQEVDIDADRSFKVNQVKALAEELSYPYGATAINWDVRYLPFPYFPIKTHFKRTISAQAVLSRYEIGDHKRIVLQKPDAPFYYNAFYIDRLIQIVEVLHPLKKMLIMNVHLEAFEKETRQAQAKVVLDWYERLDSANIILLVGDFNADISYDNSATALFLKYPSLQAVFQDGLGDKDFYTYPADKPIEKLDYIFYNPAELSLLERAVLKDIGTPSDHLPIWAKFKFK